MFIFEARGHILEKTGEGAILTYKWKLNFIMVNTFF